MVRKDNSRILVISDLHIPYNHCDALKFLTHLKDKYKPTRIICIGDELDKHAMSFHDSDPDLPSAGQELINSLPVLWELHSIFPEMDLIESNHGSMHLRKAFSAGIPKAYIKTYQEVYGTGDGWRWLPDLTIKVGKRTIMFHHGMSANAVNNGKELGMSFVQGHHHHAFHIGYWGGHDALNFGMTVGCLVDKKALAFAYGKNFAKRPIIGCAVIINGVPFLEPMELTQRGKWVG